MSSSAFGPPPGPPRRVLCIGAAVLDTLFRVRSLPSGQGKILPYEMLQVAEGMASSAAFAVARLGGHASLWGAVGDDATGERIISDLGDSGIDTSGMTVVQGARSAVSTILIDDEGERLIVPFYDERLHDTVRLVTEQEMSAFDAVLVDVRWPKLALRVLIAAGKAGKPAILDGDVAGEGVIEMLAPAASHIVFSQPAAERLAGTADLVETVGLLKRKFEHAFISVTAGEHGSLWFDDPSGDIRHLAAPKVRAIDTLAAGDIFHGAFALAIAEGMPIAETMRLSSMAAALKCQVFGGRIGAPTRAQVCDALRDWNAFSRR
ncbi:MULTISPECIES: sugar kinase [Rhizobium]|uniref:sugar kinase n=1 Tax=Rhizobium TaxID=379 RepID=UPI0007E95C3D|nr:MULTISPECIES: sugar kinase [Rhizobium]ANK94990.1 carbohydrate/purine kinase protein [Rhizobium sp. N6212]ANL01042.1 carbohydrate/purine kinase protein [Rhizobium sp. N621]ANL07163.1 carbohydrate/purine kinase protein [Rhizobium esperanzae]ANL13333.1 carbohydrate/purine kinase protein [Rhizobium sp. N1341]ANM38005.1 carbohydrate/purine kinase protein [Rhizobium sp. N871]